MKYIILLRGVNISGKNKIAMKELKLELKHHYQNVMTYLNSGNIIVESEIEDKIGIKENIEKLLNETFHLNVPLFIITEYELEELLNHSPNWWGLQNKEIYDNLIFIIPPITYEEVYLSLGEPKKELEQIQEYKNNIFWSYHLKDYQKTNWWSKTANSNISSKITIRTANTIKKLFELSKMV